MGTQGISGYEFDVFLSYAHNDNALGWVDKFREALFATLNSYPGCRNCKIWRDKEELRAGDVVDDRIEAVLRRSAVFVALHSTSYEDSAFCNGEYAFFSTTHADALAADARSRIIIVQLYDLPKERWPPGSEKLLAVPMYTSADGDKHGFPAKFGANLFQDAIQKIVVAVAERLDALAKESEVASAVSAAPIASASESPETRVARLRGDLLATLSGHGDTLTALRSAFGLPDSSTAELVADSMLQSTIPTVLGQCDAARQRLVAQRGAGSLVPLRKIVNLAMPLLIPQETIAELRQAIGNPSIKLLVPKIGLSTMAELAMAGADGRAAQFDLKDINYPRGKFVIPETAPRGPGADQSAGIADVVEHLEQKFLPDFVGRFLSEHGPPESQGYSAQRREGMVNRLLKRMSETGKTFYMLVQEPDEITSEFIALLRQRLPYLLCIELDEDWAIDDTDDLQPMNAIHASEDT